MKLSSPARQTPSPGAGFHCVTDDGITLAGVHVDGPPAAGAHVLAHGFTHGIAKPATRAAIDAFARHGAVVAADFRGHGRSGGLSSVGRDEVLDLDAVVRWVRAEGYATVTVVGFSLGGAVALRQAALGDDRPDAVVAVSAPSRWYVRESVPMRRLHWLLEHPLAVKMGAALGVRLGEPWPDLPVSPVEAAADIEVPLLLVHGTEDDYFSPDHAVALRDASRTGELWVEQGMGHGETGLTPELADRIAVWSAAAWSAAWSVDDRAGADRSDRMRSEFA
jgi:pimeloyl-ACP methyl ester carboxylesterase